LACRLSQREPLAAASSRFRRALQVQTKEKPEGTAMPSAAPISIWDLFFQNADIVVKLVMIGLLIASISYGRSPSRSSCSIRAAARMDAFEQAFWSGQSLEELYRSLSSRPSHSMAALFVRRCGNGSAAWRGMRVLSRPAGAYRRR